jgi:hypothetical protein
MLLDTRNKNIYSLGWIIQRFSRYIKNSLIVPLPEPQECVFNKLCTMSENFNLNLNIFSPLVLEKKISHVAEWLERRRKHLVIVTSPVRIPLWDVGVGPSDETV